MNYDKEKLNSSFTIVVEIAIRMGFLLLLVAWCFQIVFPFTGIIMWGLILALATAPIYDSLDNRIGRKPKLTAFIMIIAGLVVIAVPSWLFLDSMVLGLKELKESYAQGDLTIPPPDSKVEDWPIIGKKLYGIWQMASQNLPALIEKYHEQLANILKSFGEGLMSVGGSIIQFVFATIIAGVLLATKGTDQEARRFFRKIVGQKGDEFTDITVKTVQNVTKGILGVAVIQSVLIGVGFLLAGVPYAGLWAIIVMILAIVQLPPMIIVLPVIVYLFSALSPVIATLWAIYLLIAGLSDNILKPILLGKGAPVPMLVIFLGSIGGFMLSGFIGLFTGAIVLSLGYKLLMTWLAGDGDEEDELDPPPAIESM